MFAARSLIRAAPQIKSAVQVRNMTAISGPPQNRISFTEKLVHGVVMTCAYMAVPAWVLVHIREYRSKE